MTEEDRDKSLKGIQEKISWPLSLKNRATAVIEITYELELLIEAGKKIPLTSLEKPKSMMDIGRMYKRLGEAYQSFAQVLTFALLREPNNGSKKEDSAEDTSAK